MSGLPDNRGATSTDYLADLAERLDRAARRCAEQPTDMQARQAAWELLDEIRKPACLTRIGRGEHQLWAARMLELIVASNFTVGCLLRQRSERYGDKTLFEVQSRGTWHSWSWRRVQARVDLLARCLLGDSQRPGPVAILSENRLEMALVDLACLSCGLVDVMIPASATESDVRFILEQSQAETLIVSDAGQLAKVTPSRGQLERLRRVVSFDPPPPGAHGVVALDAMLPLADKVARDLPLRRSLQLSIDDLATVMYTSGTTGQPKGIRFTHRNLVFKRFARALALPEIGESDVFACFLPLCHTFGRFLEMLGCIFVGATYCFLESTSPRGLVQGMRRHRPTVFISVPKKWIQLHELIAQQADPVTASDAELAAAVRQVTGGRLRWGLSAAGHLDSDIFRLFQSQGVELMSGFGMTEATGGITMTAPGGYEDGSLGTALPGIELKLADDGELWVRGGYVMQGYVAGEGEPSGLDAEGWFQTGDLMEISATGHLRLVDRKKEIYKNVKGETIAPQRVENMFREFDSVGRAFLVGDHRDYNTLLIYPNMKAAGLDLESLSEAELRDHYRSLVVTVNRFLAPFERVVDFALIPRDLNEAEGELTAKGTPRRKAVERNFQQTVRELYRRTSVRVGGVDLLIPDWLFQILGLTAQDVLFESEAVVLPSRGTRLTVRAHAPGRSQIGSFVYRHPARPLDLGGLMTTPRLWLGNEELVTFVALDSVTRKRASRRHGAIRWAGRAAPYIPREHDARELAAYLGRDDIDLTELDLAARMLACESESDALSAIKVLEAVLESDGGPLREPTRMLLRRCAESPLAALRRNAFRLLLPAELEGRFQETLARFLSGTADLFDSENCRALSEVTLSEEKLDALLAAALASCESSEEAQRRTAAGLLELLECYGAAHPTAYRLVRAFLERMILFAGSAEIRSKARGSAERLLLGFRAWLGDTQRVAVDPERGVEYGWEDVAAFDETVGADDRSRLLSAMRGTAFVREAVFLFSPGVSIELSDIVPGGIRVRLLGKMHGKSVYRLTVQTRFQGTFELAVNVNHDLPHERVLEEIRWLVISGDPSNRRDALVEEFGGYWPQQDLWSEEFISGETLDQAMRRLACSDEGRERLSRLWPFMAWGTLSAYVDFWHRSGRRLEIADPDMTNIVVPTQDFLAGIRIVSVSRRRPHLGLLTMLIAFRDECVAQAEAQYPFLAGTVGWSVVFSALLEVVGEVEGLQLLESCRRPAIDAGHRRLAQALRDYRSDVDERGFIPMRLYFAAERYWRWARLNADATPQARALTLRALYDTYGLRRLMKSYPETRVRFYRETVFRDSSAALVTGLSNLIRRIRDGELRPDALIDAIDELRAQQALPADDEFFLARLSYPHLGPEDEADFVRADFAGSRRDIVVTLEDSDGIPFRVRHALNPKEVERLLRLFIAAKLDVHFTMEHQFLVAINERSNIIGGVYYKIDEDARIGHLEKLVVAPRLRGKRVAHGLMQELIKRLRSTGLKSLTTGFFRPDYFRQYGFDVDKRHAGMVLDLQESAGDAESVS